MIKTEGKSLIMKSSPDTPEKKIHGPMHYKIGVTGVYNGHVFYTEITRQSDPPISQFNSPCDGFTSVWSMVVPNTTVSFDFVCVVSILQKLMRNNIHLFSILLIYLLILNIYVCVSTTLNLSKQ